MLGTPPPISCYPDPDALVSIFVSRELEGIGMKSRERLQECITDLMLET